MKPAIHRTMSLMSRTSRISVGLSQVQHAREVLLRSYGGKCLSFSGAKWSTRQGEWAIFCPWWDGPWLKASTPWVLHECSMRVRASSRMNEKWSYQSKTMMTTGHGGWSSCRINLLVYEYFYVELRRLPVIIGGAKKITCNHQRSRENSCDDTILAVIRFTTFAPQGHRECP